MNTASRTLIIFVTSLLILGAGCSLPLGKNNQLADRDNKNQLEIVDTSDWVEYANETYGFSFRYPKEWGEISAGTELPDFDIGKKISISFTKRKEVSFTIFSDNFQVGIGEGTQQTFDPNLPFDGSIEVLAQALKDTGFSIESIERMTLYNNKVFAARGLFQYASDIPTNMYFLPNYLESSAIPHVSFFVMESKNLPLENPTDDAVVFRVIQSLHEANPIIWKKNYDNEYFFGYDIPRDWRSSTGYLEEKSNVLAGNKYYTKFLCSEQRNDASCLEIYPEGFSKLFPFAESPTKEDTIYISNKKIIRQEFLKNGERVAMLSVPDYPVSGNTVYFLAYPDRFPNRGLLEHIFGSIVFSFDGADWLEHVDDRYGFSFRYPKESIVFEKEESAPFFEDPYVYATEILEISTKKNEYDLWPSSFARISIVDHPLADYSLLREYFSVSPNYDLSDGKEIEISGVKAKKFGGDLSKGVEQVYYIIPIPGKNAHLFVEFSNDAMARIYEQMIEETMRFNIWDASLNWKIFESKDHQFRFRYPADWKLKDNLDTPIDTAPSLHLSRNKWPILKDDLSIYFAPLSSSYEGWPDEIAANMSQNKWPYPKDVYFFDYNDNIQYRTPKKDFSDFILYREMMLPNKNNFLKALYLQDKEYSDIAQDILSTIQFFDAADDTWAIYENSEIGISFRYPERFGTPSTTVHDYTDSAEAYLKGKNIAVQFFGKGNRYANNLSFEAYTKDFQNFWGHQSISPANETYPCEDACRIETIGGRSIRLAPKLLAGECYYDGVSLEAHFDNESTKQIYAGLAAQLDLFDASYKAGQHFNCATSYESQWELFDADVKTQSRNILLKRNLSKKDMKDLEDFYILLASIKMDVHLDISKWKEYRDDLYRFSFRYPSDWDVKVVDSAHKSWIYDGVNYKIIQLYKGEEMQAVILPEGHIGRGVDNNGIWIKTEKIGGKASTRATFPSGYAFFSADEFPIKGSEFRIETQKYNGDTKKFIDAIMESIHFFD